MFRILSVRIGLRPHPDVLLTKFPEESRQRHPEGRSLRSRVSDIPKGEISYLVKMFRLRFVIALISLTSLTVNLSAQPTFTKGINLTTWFQAPTAHEIQYSKFTGHDIAQIKSLGCDVIRLPINLNSMTSGAPDFIIDPLLFTILDSVVVWTERRNLSLILDNHSGSVEVDTDPSVEIALTKVWKQMAVHFKNSSSLILYELLNEPHGISDAAWGAIQQHVIDTIRTVDKTHTIVVGPANWNGFANLPLLPVYTDSNLIYTFHFYEPFVFTHQGASWTNPSMVPLANVPFPYNAATMPPTPAPLKGTWIESTLNDYPNIGTVAAIQAQLDIVANFKTQRNVPVFCGEFGVYQRNSDPAQRVNWYREVRQYLEQKGITWTTWDYKDSFGLFKKDSNQLFDSDLNVPLLEALGLTVPPQHPFAWETKLKGFMIYDDAFGANISNASYTQSGQLDFYAENNPHDGRWCIHWADVGQYSSIAMNFTPNVDLSALARHNFTVDFWMRTTSPDVSFEIRFVDTKASTTDHPWRKGKTITKNIVPFDGSWNHVSLPLSSLEEKGSYDDGWFPAENKFNWQLVDQLEIVAEAQDLTGAEFWFDDIRLSGEDIDPVLGVIKEKSSTFSVYPNPINQKSVIEFIQKENGPVEIYFLSVTGQRLATVTNQLYPPGHYRLSLTEAALLPNGFLLLQFIGSGTSSVQKVIKKDTQY